VHVVIGKEHTDSAVSKSLENVLNVLNGDRIDAGERFVEQDSVGLVASPRVISSRRRSPPDKV